MIDAVKRLSRCRNINEIVFNNTYTVSKNDVESIVCEHYKDTDPITIREDFIGVVTEALEYAGNHMLPSAEMLLGYCHGCHNLTNSTDSYILSNDADTPIPDAVHRAGSLLVALSLSKDDLETTSTNPYINKEEVLEFFNYYSASGTPTAVILEDALHVFDTNDLSDMVSNVSKAVKVIESSCPAGSELYNDALMVLSNIKSYYNGEAQEHIIHSLVDDYLPNMMNRMHEDIIFEAYKEDFAWESFGTDPSLYMMDHVSHAYVTYPRKEKQLTQDMINTYVDNLVRHVLQTSAVFNKSTVLLYVRDILNLVIPRVANQPNVKMYIDTALSRGYVPSANPFDDEGNVGEIKPTPSPSVAKESSEYNERYEIIMEAVNKKKPPVEEEEDPDAEDDDDEPIQRSNKEGKEMDNGRDSVSNADIQRQKKRTSAHAASAASRKIYGAFKTAESKAGVIDSSISAITKGLKKCLVGDVRSAIIEGKKITPIEALLRVLGTAAIFRVNKVAGLIALVVQFALKKSVTRSEKKKIILELEQELEIIEEKIEDAKGDGNKQAKYALMRTRNDLKTAISKIRYGLEASDKSSDTAIGVLKDARRQ